MKNDFEASLAGALQPFQRPAASQVLNNNWPQSQGKIIVNSELITTLQTYLSPGYHQGPGVNKIGIFLFLFRETEYSEWLSTAYSSGRKITWDFFDPKRTRDNTWPLDKFFWGAEFSASDSGTLETARWDCELRTFDSGGYKMAVTSGKSTVLNSQIPTFLRWPPTDWMSQSDLKLWHFTVS